jgi:hypothetical protein
MSNFILTDRKTDYLLPPSVDDWLTHVNGCWFPRKSGVGNLPVEFTG